MDSFDVAVVGSGPGGYTAAVRCAQLGARTALIEEEQAGGTCLNRGCIPTKILLETVRLHQEICNAKEFGLSVENARIDFGRVMRRKDRIVGQLRTNLEGVFKSHGVTVIHGRGEFVSGGELTVNDGKGSAGRISFRKAVVASGSGPSPLRGLEADGKRIRDTRQALALEHLPSSALVVGAGPVGLEFATIFAGLGSRVSIVEMLPRILPGEDEEIVSILAASLASRGIEIETGKVLSKAPEEHELVLLAGGRRPMGDGFGLEKAGVVTERGRVPVNGKMETSVSGIFAVGDVTGGPLLAYKAAEEGMVAAENAAGAGGREVRRDGIPRCVFSLPEVAAVGASENEALQAGHEIRVGRFPYAALGKAHALAETRGLVKMVVDAFNGGILGVHVVGPKATEIISAASLLIRMEATTEEVSRMAFPHPTLSEALHGAAMAADGKAVDLVARKR